jgi:hypothetical protein
MKAPSPTWHTREDSGFIIDRNVDWWHDGERIEHPKIIEAFNRGLSVTADGRYRLSFGDDWCFVKVVQAAFKVVAVDVSAGDRLSLRLSDRTAEYLDPSTLRLDADDAVLASVKGGQATARFSRDAQFQLEPFLRPGPKGTLALQVGEHTWGTSVLMVLEPGRPND